MRSPLKRRNGQQTRRLVSFILAVDEYFILFLFTLYFFFLCFSKLEQTIRDIREINRSNFADLLPLEMNERIHLHFAFFRSAAVLRSMNYRLPRPDDFVIRNFLTKAVAFNNSASISAIVGLLSVEFYKVAPFFPICFI